MVRRGYGCKIFDDTRTRYGPVVTRLEKTFEFYLFPADNTPGPITDPLEHDHNHIQAVLIVSR